MNSDIRHGTRRLTIFPGKKDASVVLESVINLLKKTLTPMVGSARRIAAINPTRFANSYVFQGLPNKHSLNQITGEKS